MLAANPGITHAIASNSEIEPDAVISRLPFKTRRPVNSEYRKIDMIDSRYCK
jgi:hypothetical protein